MRIRSDFGCVRELVDLRRAADHGGNGFVLGLPGSGKTMVVMEQIRDVLASSKDTVVVLDTDGSYMKFAKEMGGQIIPIGTDTGAFLNPLDLPPTAYNFWDEAVYSKVNFMIRFFEAMLGVELKPIQKVLLDRAVKKAYGRFYNSLDVVTGECDCSRLPTLRVLYVLLSCYKDDADMDLLADCLDLYVSGVWTVFCEHTNAAHESRLVVYDLSRVGHSRLESTMLAILESVKSRYASDLNAYWGNETKLWVYVDDCYPLLRTKWLSPYLLDFCRQTRLFGTIFTGVTQNVSAFFDWDATKTLLLNANYVHLMRLAACDRKMVGEFLDLQDNEISIAHVDSVGEGLVLFEGRPLSANNR